MNELSDIRPAVIPDSVDPALVLDYDFFRDARFDGAGGIPEAMAQLGREAPDLFWSPRLGGYWVIQGYEAIVDAAKRADLFSSSHMQIPAIEDRSSQPVMIPLHIDPPHHAALREPLSSVFTPTAMMKREGQIRALAIELIDEVASAGACDFFDTVAEPLPVLIFMDILGLDRAHFREFRSYTSTVSGHPDQDKRVAAILSVNDMLGGHVAARGAAPAEDLVSHLLALEIDGKPISQELVLGYTNLLFFAGLDTVANAMAFIIRHLAHDQALQQRLRDEPGKIKTAMEELLRRYAVAPVVRTVSRDERWRGADLRAGDMVVLNYPVANIDGRAFEGGDRINIDRERISHIAFGAGPHRCIGRHLARIEINVMLEEWLARVPAFRPDPSRPDQMRGGHVIGMEALRSSGTPEHPALPPKPGDY